MPAAAKHSLSDKVSQSPPLEFPGEGFDDAWLRYKTILITGGASGFGEGFVRRWAKAGAVVVFGDLNTIRGERLEKQVRAETGNADVHFIFCNVTSWESQVNLFKQAVKLSHHGGIDTVVANAGIAEAKAVFENPKDLDAENPPAPALDVLDVNLTGVVYTCHLAIFWLAKNPGSVSASPKSVPAETHRDRHLLLIASIAGLAPIPSQALYGASKHAVVGLFRCFRGSLFVHGIRCTMLNPYFIDTPLLSASARAILAGGTLGKTEDVVEAATRFAADTRIVGRAVCVGPKLNIRIDEDGEWSLLEGGGAEGKGNAFWEVCSGDFDDTDVFNRNIIGVMNRATEIRGWLGWTSDMVGAVSYGIRAWVRS